MLPAHGPVLPALDAVARAYRDHRQDRLEQVRAALRHWAPDAGVARRGGRRVRRRRPSVRRAAELSVAAQLDYLRCDGPVLPEQGPAAGTVG